MMKIYQTYLWAVFFCVLTMTLILPTAADAQNNKKLTQTEDIAIAFYKTADVVPNFENWVKKTSPYRDTPTAKRPKVMKEQIRRLMEEYDAYTPRKNDIRLRVLVTLDPQENIIPPDNEDDPPIISHSLKITFKQAPEIFYFPFEHVGQHYALMPFELDKILTQDIDADYFNFLSETNSVNNEYYMYMSMRARESLIDHPIEIDGLNQWVLKTDIAAAEVWHNNQVIWEHTAQWYVAPELKKLQAIYDLKPTGSENKGDVKPFIIERQ